LCLSVVYSDFNVLWFIFSFFRLFDASLKLFSNSWFDIVNLSKLSFIVVNLSFFVFNSSTVVL
jgi:hypothetical protein